MKAVAVFPRTREIKVIEHQVPQLTLPDQAKLRILDVGVCGTDKEICAFAYGTPPPDSDYLVIGHESLAEVIEVGPMDLAPSLLATAGTLPAYRQLQARQCRSH